MRGCSGTWLCALGVLIGLAPAAEGAVDDYIGKPIASVRLLVEGRESTEASQKTSAKPATRVRSKR